MNALFPQSSTLRVLGDWGTTRLRLALVDERRIVEHREGPGVGALDRSAADTLKDSIGDWRAHGSLRVVLAGMAGSRNGLIEAPYVPTPADQTAWSRAACSVVVDDMHVTVAAGLRHERNDSADVMRGEENQIFGALAMDSSLTMGTHVLILPGTHSKWVEIIDGSISRFHTALTGELYALMRDHSMLLRAGADCEQVPGDADVGFSAGVARALDSRGGLVTHAFEARAAQLLGGRSRSWASGFLSGLAIGEEIAGLSSLYCVAEGVRLIGDSKLAALYARAFAQQGIKADNLDGAGCALLGLRSLDRFHAGLAS